jgi:general secretion pathway protein G
MRRLSTAGMTLIEVLAVVVILGLLAATLVGGLSGRLGTARHELAKTQIAQVVNAIEAFNLATGRPPSAGEGLQVLSGNPQAPYFLEAGKVLDPWSRPYQYLIPGPGGLPYEVVTFGADGQQGGTGEDADVSSADLRR